MSDKRSIFAGFGTASMLAAAALCALLIGTAVISYNGWPGSLVGQSDDGERITIATGGARAARIAAERIGGAGRAAAATGATASASASTSSAAAQARPEGLVSPARDRARSGPPADLRATSPTAAGPQASAAPGGQSHSSASGGLAGLPNIPGNPTPELTRELGESVKQAGSGLAGAVGGGTVGDFATSTTTVLGDAVIDLGNGMDAGDDPPPP